ARSPEPSRCAGRRWCQALSLRARRPLQWTAAATASAHAAHRRGTPMARNVRRMQCGPESVFEVIGEGWLYPAWVVGASRMREVDSSWPQPGSRLHHSVGVWPALIDDSTSCTEWDPPRRAVL